MAPFRVRGRGRRVAAEEDEDEDEDEEGYLGYDENGAAEQPPQSDDLRVERMDISSDEGEPAHWL